MSIKLVCAAPDTPTLILTFHVKHRKEIKMSEELSKIIGQAFFSSDGSDMTLTDAVNGLAEALSEVDVDNDYALARCFEVTRIYQTTGEARNIADATLVLANEVGLSLRKIAFAIENYRED